MELDKSIKKVPYQYHITMVGIPAEIHSLIQFLFSTGFNNTIKSGLIILLEFLVVIFDLSYQLPF